MSLSGKKACLYSRPASLGHHAVGWAKADKQAVTEPGPSRHSGAPGPTEAFVAIGDMDCFSMTHTQGPVYSNTRVPGNYEKEIRLPNSSNLRQ